MNADRDVLYDLCSVPGRLRFDHRKHETRIFVEPYPEPEPIHMFFADNRSQRWDSAVNTLRVLDSNFYPIDKRFKRK